MSHNDDRETQYRVVDAIVFVLVFAGIALLFTGCGAAPTDPIRPPTPPKPGVCFGLPPCVAL